MTAERQDIESFPHVAAAMQYARDVVSGAIPACKWTKAACQRQLDDLDREANDPAWPYWFDAAAADREIRFVELCPHVKGKWAGQPLRLEAWQKFSDACVYGWKRKADGLRRFRKVYEEVPRKNAKTTKLAPKLLYHLTADNELGAEVYSAATTRDQAKIVFEIGAQMARMSPDFRARFGVGVFAHSLAVMETGSKAAPLSAEGSTLDGLNIAFAAIDELHAHKTRAVHDVIDTGTGARAQPLVWMITTAGSNRAGICYEQRAYLCKILNAVLKRHAGMGYRVEGPSTDDESFWGVIYTIDEADDPLDEQAWRKANPNFGISVDVDDLRRKALAARVTPSAMANFLTKHLNVWVAADSAWMDMVKFEACRDRDMRIEDFVGEECIESMDAAFKTDVFAQCKLFRRDGHYYAFMRYYMPQALVEREGLEHFAGWAREGRIVVSEGEVIDIERVRDTILGPDDGTAQGDIELHQVREIAYDPAQLTQFATEMVTEGLPMVEIRPTVLNFSPGMKELEALVAQKKFHYDCPILEWMVANVICHRDEKDNIYPKKDKNQPGNKIDGVIAVIMALSRWLVIEPADDTLTDAVVAL